MLSAQIQQYYTPEQYLEMERKAPYKSEIFAIIDLSLTMSDMYEGWADLPEDGD